MAQTSACSHLSPSDDRLLISGKIRSRILQTSQPNRLPYTNQWWPLVVIGQDTFLVTSRQGSLIDWLIPINYILDACLFHACYLYWCIDYITSGMTTNSAAQAYLWSNDNLLASKNCACCCFAQQRQNIPWPITANDMLWIFSETECFQNNPN